MANISFRHFAIQMEPRLRGDHYFRRGKGHCKVEALQNLDMELDSSVVNGGSFDQQYIR